MVFSGDSLDDVIKKIQEVIESGQILDFSEQSAFLKDFLSRISVKKNWDLSDFLIELEICLAVSLKTKQVPLWRIEDLSEILFLAIVKKIDSDFQKFFLDLHYNQIFVERRTAAVARILSEEKIA